MPTAKQLSKIRESDFAYGFNPVTGEYPKSKKAITSDGPGEVIGTIALNEKGDDLKVIPIEEAKEDGT